MRLALECWLAMSDYGWHQMNRRYHDRRFRLGVASAVLVLLALCLAGAWLGYHLRDSSDPALDRSEVAQWIVAASSVLTLVAATVAAAFAARTVQIELDRDDERRRDQISQQASRVVAWAADSSELKHFLTAPRIADSLEGPLPPVVTVFVANRSDLPVTEVRVEVTARTTTALPDGSKVRLFFPVAESSIDVLVPTDANPKVRMIQRPDALEESLPEWASNPTHELIITMQFVDSFGRRWERTPDTLNPVS